MTQKQRRNTATTLVGSAAVTQTMSSVPLTEALPWSPKCNRKVLVSLERWVPSRHPSLWVVINSLCLASSIAVLAQVLLATDDEVERPEAAAWYFVWYFGTCVIWCIEAGLESWWSHSAHVVGGTVWARESPSSAIELVIAVYFSIDSVLLLYRWEIMKQDVYAELFDVIISCAAYTYALARDSSKYRESGDMGVDFTEIV
jgi:hypothetical protein